MLMRLAEDARPERMAVVFDAGRKTFRTDLYPDYKAHRPPAPEDLTVQMPYFPRIASGLGWPVISVPGVEADDVIATLTTAARARGWEVVIYSADKDLMQLVGDHVTMIDALRQQTYTREEVIKKMGVPPEQIADYLALVGDASDNIPGLAGVGEKTALKMLQDHGSLAALIAANPVVPRIKVKQPFSDPEQRARVEISRQLVELKRDVALPRGLDDLAVAPWDTAALDALFGELEFAALVDKVRAHAGRAATPATPALPVTPAPAMTAVASPGEAPASRIVVRGDELAALAAAARAAGTIALTVELDPQRPELAGLVAIVVAVAGAPACYVPLGHRYIGAPVPPLAGDLAPLLAVLGDPAIAKICHDSKTAIRALAARDVALAGVVEDTMLAAFLLDPESEAEAGEAVVHRLAGVELPARATLAGRGKHSLESVDVERAAAWAGAITHALPAIAAELPARLGGGGLLALYRDVELPIARLLATVERTGIHIDGAHFAALGAEVAAQLATLERTVFDLAGEPFNLGSPKQLGVILFEKLGLPTGRRKATKAGYSTDHEVLEELLDAHPIIAPVLEHRELAKLKGTYLDALPPLVSARTGRLHTTFNQVAAATGRISSQDPNLQNIPIRRELGRRIRAGFVAAPGHVLIAADYSQIELRILAHLSGDPKLSAAFRDRVDVHTQTAAEVFGIDRDAVGPDQRRIAKAVNYGLSYGQSDFGLARTLGISRTEAADYSRRYFARFPTIRHFMEDVVAQARAQGGARTLLGRWRPIPNLTSKAPQARAQAERIAQNTPMQGAGADLIKLAMLATTARLARDGLVAPMLLTVHDELVFEARAEIAERVGAIVQEEMEQVHPLTVPLVVDVGIARSWADA
jgi:DNA polymerase-1